MKILVKSPIKCNGSFYPVGSFISFKNDEVPESLVQLVEAVPDSTKETAKPTPAIKKTARPPKGVASKAKKKTVSKTKSEGK